MKPQSQTLEASSSPTDKVRTLAVDDHRQFRETLRTLVTATSGFVLVGLAGSGEEAVRAVDALSPRLVLMDIRMPDMDGIEATRRILQRHLGVVVVLISVDDPSLFSGAASLGDSVAFARKQELSPQRLRELWDRHHT